MRSATPVDAPLRGWKIRIGKFVVEPKAPTCYLISSGSRSIKLGAHERRIQCWRRLKVRPVATVEK